MRWKHRCPGYYGEKGNKFGVQRYPYLRTIDECKAAAANNQWVTCSFTALMASTKAFTEVGGLDTRFEPCEDFEFLNRFVDNHYILVINPVVLMKYRIHPSAVTVRKPMLVFDTISYVKHSIELRRQ